MRFFLKIMFLLLIGLPFAAAAALFLAVDTQPTISRAAEVTPSSIERAKRILEQNDPRKLTSGARRTIAVTAGDLDLAANYLAHQYGGGAARVELNNGKLIGGASLKLPRLPVNLYVNVDATLVEQTPLPRLESLRVGKLPIPSRLAYWLMAKAPKLIRADLELNTLSKIVENIAIKASGVSLTYEWREGTLKTLRAAVLPPEDQERLAIYQELLVSLTHKHKGENIALVEFLARFFQLAKERSSDGDAVGENRAAIIVLAFYVNGKNIGHLLPEMKPRQRPVMREVRLNQREDFAQHFILSAALAANTGGPLSNAIGLYKEITDSRGGSGFSFNDIAADRAGSRFGEVATNRATAQKLQIKVGAGIDEGDIIPTIADLPEFMSEGEFKRRFGGIDGPEYKKMMADIEGRIAALPLYR